MSQANERYFDFRHVLFTYETFNKDLGYLQTRTGLDEHRDMDAEADADCLR